MKRVLPRPPPSEGFLSALIIIAVTVFGWALAYLWEPSARVAGGYVPMDHDGYYHAVRILDAVQSGALVVFQYDHLMHVPEGNWVSWPWGYDSLMAGLLRLLQSLFPTTAQDYLLGLLPLLWVPVNVSLVVLIGRVVGLSAWVRLILALSYVAGLGFVRLHAFGVLDHHQAEQALYSAALLAWLLWLRAPNSARRAVACGVVIGIAPAFHASLIFVHLASIALLGMLWMRNSLPTPRSTLLFAFALLLTAVSVALVSAPFRARFGNYGAVFLVLVPVLLCTQLCTGRRQRLLAPGLTVAMLALAAPSASALFKRPPQAMDPHEVWLYTAYQRLA